MTITDLSHVQVLDFALAFGIYDESFVFPLSPIFQYIYGRSTSYTKELLKIFEQYAGDPVVYKTRIQKKLLYIMPANQIVFMLEHLENKFQVIIISRICLFFNFITNYF